MRNFKKYVSLAVSFIMVVSSFAACSEPDKQDIAEIYNKAVDDFYASTQLSFVEHTVYKDTQNHITVEWDEHNTVAYTKDSSGNVSQFSSECDIDHGEFKEKRNIYFDGSKMHLDDTNYKYMSQTDVASFTDCYINILGYNPQKKVDLTRFNDVTSSTDDNDITTVKYSQPADDYKSSLYEGYSAFFFQRMGKAGSVSEFSGEAVIDSQGKLTSEKTVFTLKVDDKYFIEIEKTITINSSVTVNKIANEKDFKTVDSVAGVLLFLDIDDNEILNGNIQNNYKLSVSSANNINVSRQEKLSYMRNSKGTLDYSYDFETVTKDAWESEKTYDNGVCKGKTVKWDKKDNGIEREVLADTEKFVGSRLMQVGVDINKVENIALSGTAGNYQLTVIGLKDVTEEYIESFSDLVKEIRSLTVADITSQSITLKLNNGVMQGKTIKAEFDGRIMGRDAKCVFEAEQQLTYGDVTQL